MKDGMQVHPVSSKLSRVIWMLPYQSALAAITKYHRLGGLNHRCILFYSSGVWKSECWVLRRILFLTCQQQPSPCALGEGRQGSAHRHSNPSFSLLRKPTNLIMEVQPSGSHLTLVSSQSLHIQISMIAYSKLWFLLLVEGLASMLMTADWSGWWLLKVEVAMAIS